MKPKLFIGSSVEGLSIAYAVQQNLSHQAEITVWDQGVFNLSKSALESLIQILDRCDFGVFVFTPDDIVNIRGEKNRAIRDNVLFELGLFVGRLGRERSFIIAPREQKDLHLPTDLIGMTLGAYESDRTDGNHQAATGPVCHDIRQNISKLGRIAKESVSAQTPSVDLRENKTKNFEDETTTVDVEEAFQEVRTEEPSWMELFEAAKYDDVIKMLEEKIEQSEDDSDIILFKVWIGRAKARKSFKEGINYFKELREAYPSQDDLYIATAAVYVENDLLDDALKILDEGLLTSEEKVWLKHFKAVFLAQEERIEEAIEILVAIQQEHPEFASSYLRAADILKEQDKKEEVKRTYEAGLKALPNNKELLFGFSLFLSEIEENDGALTNFRKLIGLEPENSTYLTYLGNVYLSLELNGLALEAYLKANKLAESKQEWIIANIGNLYKNRGFYPQAIEFLQEALKIDQNSSYAHERLSTAIKADKDERKKANDIIAKYKQMKSVAAKSEQQISTDGRSESLVSTKKSL